MPSARRARSGAHLSGWLALLGAAAPAPSCLLLQEYSDVVDPPSPRGALVHGAPGVGRIALCWLRAGEPEPTPPWPPGGLAYGEWATLSHPERLGELSGAALVLVPTPDATDGGAEGGVEPASPCTALSTSSLHTVSLEPFGAGALEAWRPHLVALVGCAPGVAPSGDEACGANHDAALGSVRLVALAVDVGGSPPAAGRVALGLAHVASDVGARLEGTLRVAGELDVALPPPGFGEAVPPETASLEAASLGDGGPGTAELLLAIAGQTVHKATLAEIVSAGGLEPVDVTGGRRLLLVAAGPFAAPPPTGVAGPRLIPLGWPPAPSSP